uniref:Uncharacterized protein n=1 Tax=Desulfovibrio sp. U5L TaxID=596152 RepID=I2Q051_9BACT
MGSIPLLSVSLASFAVAAGLIVWRIRGGR